MNRTKMKLLQVISQSNFHINFKEPKQLSHPTIKGGSVQQFGNNHVLYDNNNIMIGNIRSKRYKYLQTKFCEYYNIKDLEKVEKNDSLYEYWCNELNRVMKYYSYGHKKFDIAKTSRMQNGLINDICDIFSLNNLDNFNPFNIPMKTDKSFVSNINSMFGSVPNRVGGNSFVNTIFSPKFLDYKLKSINNTQDIIPLRNIISVPIIPNKNQFSYLIDDAHKLCVIPSRSLLMKTADNWYDVEYNDILNKYPIAIYHICNEVSLDINPLNKSNLKDFEKLINSHLINNTIIVDQKIIPLQKEKKIIEPYAQPLINIAYTDASIRQHNKVQTSGIGVWFGSRNTRNISTRFDINNINDINICELFAIYLAIINADPDKELHIYTDSMVALKLLEHGYLYETVQNKKYEIPVKKILLLIKLRKHKTIISKVKAHNNNIGNDNADYMARLGIYNNDSPYNILEFLDNQFQLIP